MLGPRSQTSRSMVIDFFVSYNKADADWAVWMSWQLESAGYSVVVQAWDFLPGQSFVRSMDQALHEARRLLAVVSPDWQASDHTRAEWEDFYRLDPSSREALILPVKVRECDVRGVLGPRVWVDLAGLPDEALASQRLLHAVRALQPLPSGATPPRDPRRLKPRQAPPYPGAAAAGAPPAPPPVDYSHLKKRKLPLEGIEDELFSIAFSRDGQWLAAGSNRTVLLWNLRRGGGPIRTDGHRSYVYSVAFSWDSSRLVTGGEDGYVRVFSVSPLKPIWARHEHTEAVYSVAFSRDGRRVASGGYDGRVLLWEAERGQALRGGGSAVDGAGRVTSVAFSPNDKLLAFGSLKDTVWLLDIERGDAQLVGRHDSSVEGVAFSPNGRYLASCGLDKAVRLWNVADPDQRVKWSRREHEYVVRSVAFSPDGQTLASVGWDKRLNLWDVETGELRASLPFRTNDRHWHSDWIWSVAFSAEDMLLASSGSDGRIVLWQVDGAR